MLFIRKILITLFFFICLQSYSQKKSCIIYFKDSTTLAGYGKMNSDNDITFKLNDESEPIVYKKELIDKFQIEDRLYQYKLTKNKPTSGHWLRIIIEGKVNLYEKDDTYYYAYTTKSMPSGATVVSYYLEREGEIKIYKITSHGEISKNFKKSASRYFKDCPELVKKIKDNTFKKTDIEEVVQFYNSICGK